MDRETRATTAAHGYLRNQAASGDIPEHWPRRGGFPKLRLRFERRERSLTRVKRALLVLVALGALTTVIGSSQPALATGSTTNPRASIERAVRRAMPSSLGAAACVPEGSCLPQQRRLRARARQVPPCGRVPCRESAQAKRSRLACDLRRRRHVAVLKAAPAPVRRTPRPAPLGMHVSHERRPSAVLHGTAGIELGWVRNGRSTVHPVRSVVSRRPTQPRSQEGDRRRAQRERAHQDLSRSGRVSNGDISIPPYLPLDGRPHSARSGAPPFGTQSAA